MSKSKLQNIHINYKLCIDNFQESPELDVITKSIILTSDFDGNINDIIFHIFNSENIDISNCEFLIPRLVYV